MDYGVSDTSTTSLGVNQFPIADVHVPNVGLKALGGGPKQTDAGGKDYAPALMYIQDGSDVAQGTTTDAANASTVVGQLKQIQTNTSGGATAANQTTANTSLSSVATNTSNTATNTSNINTATGAKADSAATDSTSSWSIIAMLKGIYAKLAGTLSISGAVTQSGTWTVQPGNTANTTAWKVDGSAVTQPVSGTFWQATQPVSGTITANAGTNLNTSLLALESGGHLANIDTHTPALGSAVSASSSPVVIASDQAAVASKRSTVAVFTQASGATSGSTQNSGDLTVGPYTEISLDINTTAQSGTSPTIQYFYERKGADNIYYVLWQSAVLTAAANTLSTSIGSGMAYNQSLGLTGRLRWVVGGSVTPTFTHSINCYGK